MGDDADPRTFADVESPSRYLTIVTAEASPRTPTDRANSKSTEFLLDALGLSQLAALTHANPDRTLHEFAERSLPMLRDHLATAEALR